MFAVGEAGAAIHGFGNTWVADTIPGVEPSATLFGVWGSAPDNVWAVGGTQSLPDSPSTIVHYDGAQWSSIDTSALPPALLFKVWGSGADDVWAVGAGGVILHYDGSSWTAAGSPTSQRLIAVWGTGPDDVYAVGGLGMGLVLRFDGVEWSLFATTAEDLSGVWTAPGRPLYVAGNRGLVARYAIDENGTARAEAVSSKSPFPDVCIHGLVGHRGGLVGAAADLIGGTSTAFRGGILGHAVELPDDVSRASRPDAGPIADAAPPQDAINDAGPTTDASGIGQSCQPPLTCEGQLQCWLLQISNEAICTRACNFASECADLGPAACCERPGIQTLVTVCMPSNADECINPI
jgi:hypothetical protein